MWSLVCHVRRLRIRGVPWITIQIKVHVLEYWKPGLIDWLFAAFPFRSRIFHLYRESLLLMKSWSSTEPLGQIQPNLALIILRWMVFKFVQLKSPSFFQWEIITKLRKYIDKFRKSSPEPLRQFQPNMAQIILGWREFKFVQMKGPFFSKGR